MNPIILPATLELTRSVSVSLNAPPPDVRMVRDKLYLERDLRRMRSELNPRQQQIFDLAINGLNVFPIPWRSKGGTRWKFMQYTAFEPHQIARVFSMRYYNVAMMMGHTSGNLFTLDLETDSAWNHFTRELTKRGIPFAGQRSGKPGGGGHLFFYCLEGEVANLPKNEHRVDSEVRGHRNYVVVAPSLHPQGTAYHWVAGSPFEIPRVSIEDVRWLGLELYSERKARLQRRDPTINLCNTSQGFINFGAPEGVRNNTLFKTACDMNGCGYSRQEAGEKAGQAAYLSGLEWSKINKTLDSAYKEPRTPSRQYAMLHDLMPKWMLAITFALDRQWTGRTGTTDRAVLIAAALCAQAADKDGVYRASCREVAEKAHVNKSIAAESLHRLQDMGLLKHVSADGSSSAYRYAFNWEQINAERSHLQKPDTHLAPSWGNAHVRLLQKLLATDLPERGSLGWPGLLLYINLVRAKQPLKVTEMMALSNLSQAQVYRALNKLKAAGVVYRNSKTYRYRVAAVEPEVLNERISVPRGKAGYSRRRREKHKLERQQRAIRILSKDLGKYQGRTRFYKTGALPIGWRSAKQPSGGVSRWRDRMVRLNAPPDQPRLL
jgi:predicted transcriptional regulator